MDHHAQLYKNLHYTPDNISHIDKTKITIIMTPGIDRWVGLQNPIKPKLCSSRIVV